VVVLIASPVITRQATVVWSGLIAEEEKLSEPTFHYSIFIKRAVTGLILGGLAGAVQVWFFKRDLMHLWASLAAGVVYMVVWVTLTDWLKLAGGKILLGGVSGLLAAIVWWSIAVPADNAFIQAAVAGTCFGAAFAWSDQRKT
jgi:hypothetical protein